MSKIIKITLIIGILTALIFTISCDKVELPKVGNTPDDTLVCDVPTFPAFNPMGKRVLLEEFTGHLCNNCPAAARAANEIAHNHNNRVIILASHVINFAQPSPPNFPYDFRTTEGNEWAKKFVVQGLPAGMANRKYLNEDDGFLLGNIATWRTVVESILNETQTIGLQLIVNYDSTNRKVCSHVKANFLQPLNMDTEICLVITESKIIKPQMDKEVAGGVVLNYEHNHVLRGSINGAWGTQLTQEGNNQTEPIVKTFKTLLKDEFVAKNCSVIAFIYNKSTLEIFDVVEQHIVL